jgi:hypothetical protein
MEKRKLIIWVVIGVFLVGGIGYIVWPKTAPDSVGEGTETTEQPAATEQVVIEPSPTRGDVGSDGVTETQPPTSEAVVATEIPKPTPRQGLVSTDPQTVNLASGDIQLVELFAFW